MTTDLDINKEKFEDVAIILKDFLKVIKVVSMYPEDNPLPQSLRRSFSDKFESTIDKHGDVHLKIDEDSLLMNDELVFQDKSKEERLAGILYDAGLTEISFLAGFNLDQCYILLEILKEYVNSSDRSLDLAALFWEASLPQFAFKTLEDVALADYDDDFDLRDFISVDDTMHDRKRGFLSSDTGQYGAIFTDEQTPDDAVDDNEKVTVDEDFQVSVTDDQPVETEDNKSIFFSHLDETGTNITDREEKLKTSEAVSAMGYSDLDPQPAPVLDTGLILNEEFQLSTQEDDEVQAIIRKDAEFDPFESVQDLVKEIMLQENELNSFSETVSITDKIIIEFISYGRLAEASSILKFTRKLEERVKKDKPQWAQRLRECTIVASTRERMHLLAEVLNKLPELNPVELNSYLENFGWEAVNSVTDLIGLVEHEPHRECVNKFLIEQGKKNVDVIARNIYDKNPEIVCNAVKILVKIGDDRAMRHLEKLTSHEDNIIRFTLVKSLKGCPHDDALQILQDAVFDDDHKIRQIAVNNLLDRKDEKAFKVISDILSNKDFPKMNSGEKTALLNAFSMLGGENAVPYLIKLATFYNLFGNSNIRFFRKAAFDALSRNKSERCESALKKLTKTWRIDIKKRARKALRKRRAKLNGDNA